MKLTEMINKWTYYPIDLFKKAQNDPDNYWTYKKRDMAKKIGDGLIAGGIGYLITDNKDNFVYGPIAAIIGRTFQLYLYQLKNRK